MYYECHVIVRPPFDTAKVRDLSRGQGWWGSILKHDDGNEELVGDFIITTRGDTHEDTEARMMTLVRAIQATGANVRRYKIEHAVLDSKYYDKHCLIVDDAPDE